MQHDHHAFLPKYEAKGLARRTPWGHRGACECGAAQKGLAGTKKDALRWYYQHREEAS